MTETGKRYHVTAWTDGGTSLVSFTATLVRWDESDLPGDSIAVFDNGVAIHGTDFELTDATPLSVGMMDLLPDRPRYLN